MHRAGSLIAFDCASGTIAIDGKRQRNGLFTKHLLKHITALSTNIPMILKDTTRGMEKESGSRQMPS